MTVETAAAPAAATPTPGPAPAGRDSIVAEMAALRASAPAPAATPKPEEKAPAEPADPTPEADPADPEGEPSEPAADDDDADGEAAELDAEPAAADPDRDKRIAAIQKEEKRQRAAVDTYRRKVEADLAEKYAELDRRRNEHAPALERFEAAQKRAKIDPIGYLETVLGADLDHDYLARQAHARTKAGAADPRYREAAERAQRDREAAEKLSQLDQKLADIDRREQEREQQAIVQQNITAYLEKAAKAVGEDTPLVKAMMAKNPEKTRQHLHRIAVELSDELGSIPEPADVAKALEKFRRDELAELGIDPSAVITKATPKKPAPVAGEKKRPVTPSTDPGNSPEPRTAPRSREDERAQIVREMREAVAAQAAE